jgi:hypothetical protein
VTATLQTYISQVQRLVHDASNSAWSQSELTDYINEAREDIALDMHCVRLFVTGVQLLPGQEVYNLINFVPGAVIINGGANYSPTTSLTFSAPAFGATATGFPTVVNGSITAVTMTQWGSGYGTLPSITVTDGPGSGAIISALWVPNLFNIVSISNIWNNQRYTLGFRGFTMFQAYFRAWTTQFTARPGIWTIHPQMLQVYLRPAPDQIYMSEWDVLCLPLPLVNLTDADSQVVPPWNKAVQFRAASMALMKHQNFAQAEYYNREYDKRVPRYITGAGGIRIPNPYNRSLQRKMAR